MSLPPQQRYQFKPLTGSSHAWALEQILKLDRSASILDIGAGSGSIGRVLKENSFKDLYAVEISQSARQHIKDFYLEVQPQISGYHNQEFDIILLLDVLEHIAEPKAFLEEALKHLKKEGQILISVPNIAHWSARFSLLFGFFEYTERGILDKTHLRFFTKRSLNKFLKQFENLETTDSQVSIEPIELVLPAFVSDNKIFKQLAKIRLSFANLLPGLMGYQHLRTLHKTF